MTAAQILREAAAHVLRNWTQWTLENRVTGAVCALGGINKAYTASAQASEDVSGAIFALARQIQTDGVDLLSCQNKRLRPRSSVEFIIATWNDTYGRTRCQVARAMLLAAERLERLDRRDGAA